MIQKGVPIKIYYVVEALVNNMTGKERVVYKNLTVKKERRFRVGISLRTIIYIILIILLIIFIIFILVKEHLVLYFTREGSIYEIYLFSILVPLMLLIYLLSCGISISFSTNAIVKLLILGIIIYLIYLGYTTIGIGIQFATNFDLLNYEFYESNSYRGIKFFMWNYFPFFFFIYIISIALDFGDDK